MSLRDLDFSDSLESSVTPTGTFLQASNLQQHASDAAFVTAKGSAAADGDVYLNTTDGLIHYYDSAWKIKVDSASAQTLENKALEADTTTLDDGGDATKQLDVDLSAATTSTKTTIASSQSANRTVTLPDATTTLVGTDTAQVLTAKDIDGGTASDTSRITIPKDTKTNLDGLTRKAGTVVYATDEDKLYYDDGSNLLEVGSGSGGSTGVNYFEGDGTFGLFETDATGVSEYDDTGAYVDGTGGTAGAISFAVTTTGAEILEGSQSLKLSKAASDASGMGFTFTPGTIDPDQRGKELVFSLSHDGGSANYNGSDISVHAYDVTNSEELDVRPLNYTDSDKNPYILGFQCQQKFAIATSNTTASVRISLHIESDSVTGSAWDLVVDRVSFGPQDPVLVAPIGDWQSYTPTFGAGFGTPTDVSMWYKVIGDTLYISGSFVNGTPGAALGTLGLPSGFTIDTSKIDSGTRERSFGTVVKVDADATTRNISNGSATPFYH